MNTTIRAGSFAKFTVVFFVLISATGCNGKTSSGEQSSKSPNSDQTDSTVFVDSPYFSGSLKLTDQEGWIYKVDVPNLINLECSIHKTLKDSPPGKANVEVHFNSGNTKEIEITPNTPGRNAPLVVVNHWHLVQLPLSLKNEQGEIPVISIPGVIGYLGLNNGGPEFTGFTRLDYSDFDLTTDDNSVSSDVFLSGLMCGPLNLADDFSAGPIIEKNKLSSESEQDVNYLVSIFQELPVLVVNFSNGCNLAFTASGDTYAPVSEKLTQYTSELKPYTSYFPALWSGEISCTIG